MFLMLLSTVDEEDKPDFAALYRKNLSWMLRLANTILKNEQDAEDAVQEAFLYLAKNYHVVKNKDDSAVRAALTVLTKHRSLDILRKRHTLNGVEEWLEEVPGNELPPDSGIALEQAIASLPPMERETFLLCVGDGYSIGEIAEMMRIKKDSVRKNLSRARHALRKRLNGDE